MRNQSARFIMSFILIGLGVLILLSNLGLLPESFTSDSWFIVAVFAIIGGGFLVTYLADPREQWWSIIPAFTLLGLAVLVGGFLPGWAGAAMFLGMIGLSFLVILLTRPQEWWAVIPAGALGSVAALIATASVLDGQAQSGIAAAAVLILGLAVTFLLVFLRPVEGKRMTWALWPAGILSVVGVLLLLGYASLINYLWAVALILGGGMLIFRSARRPV